MTVILCFQIEGFFGFVFIINIVGQSGMYFGFTGISFFAFTDLLFNVVQILLLFLVQLGKGGDFFS